MTRSTTMLQPALLSRSPAKLTRHPVLRAVSLLHFVRPCSQNEPTSFLKQGVSGAALQAELGQSDRKSFRERYLNPAPTACVAEDKQYISNISDFLGIGWGLKQKWLGGEAATAEFSRWQQH